MPPKKTRAKARTSKKSQKGGAVKLPTLKEVAKFVKDNKVLSKTLGVIPHRYAQTASKVLDQAGLGKKKRKCKAASAGAVSSRGIPKLPTGGSVRAPIAVHTARLAVAPQMVSTSAVQKRALAKLRAAGQPIARIPGQRGSGFFSDLGSGIGSVFGGLGGGIGSIIRGVRG